MIYIKSSQYFTVTKYDLWNKIINFSDYHWKHNILRVNFHDENKFTEESVDGFSTEFEINLFEKYNRCELKFTNELLTGAWLIIFEDVEGGCKLTLIINAEAVDLKNHIKAKKHLQSILDIYIEDLKKYYENQMYSVESKTELNLSTLSISIILGAVIGTTIFDNAAIGICLGILVGIFIK